MSEHNHGPCAPSANCDICDPFWDAYTTDSLRNELEAERAARETFKSGCQKLMDDMKAEHQKLFHANSRMSVLLDEERAKVKAPDQQPPDSWKDKYYAIMQMNAALLAENKELHQLVESIANGAESDRLTPTGQLVLIRQAAQIILAKHKPTERSA